MFPSDRAPLPRRPDKATHLRGGWRRRRGPRGLGEERTGGERDRSDQPCCLYRSDPALGTSLAPHSLPWGRPRARGGCLGIQGPGTSLATSGSPGAELGQAGRGREGEMVRTESSGQDASPETERARFPEANTSTCLDPGMGVPALRSLHPQDPDPGPPPSPALRQALLLYQRVRGAEGQVGGSGRSEPACPSHIPETCPALSPLTAPTHPSRLSSGPAPAPRP